MRRRHLAGFVCAGVGALLAVIATVSPFLRDPDTVVTVRCEQAGYDRFQILDGIGTVRLIVATPDQQREPAGVCTPGSWHVPGRNPAGPLAHIGIVLLVGGAGLTLLACGTRLVRPAPQLVEAPR